TRRTRIDIRGSSLSHTHSHTHTHTHTHTHIHTLSPLHITCIDHLYNLNSLCDLICQEFLLCISEVISSDLSVSHIGNQNHPKRSLINLTHQRLNNVSQLSAPT